MVHVGDSCFLLGMYMMYVTYAFISLNRTIDPVALVVQIASFPFFL